MHNLLLSYCLCCDSLADTRQYTICAATDGVQVQYTSGSSGTPKGALVASKTLLHEMLSLVSTDVHWEGSGVGLIDAPLATSGDHTSNSAMPCCWLCANGTGSTLDAHQQQQQ